jgi:CRP/FNR family transcriptional regulator
MTHSKNSFAKAATLPGPLRDAAEIDVPLGKCVFSQGQRADHYLVVTRGSVKVFARSSEGREVVLYRVRAGEMCTLTTSCLLGHAKYPAEAITETDVRAKVLDAAEFERALDESAAFRQFVFRSLGERLAEILERMQALVLETVQLRLIRCLLSRTGDDGVAHATHEQLALDVGTAREVVSRHLKSLEHEGLIETQRGRIFVLRRKTLEALC